MTIKELNFETIKYNTGEYADNLLGLIVELIGWSLREDGECLNNFFLSYFGETSLEDVKRHLKGYLFKDYIELLDIVDKHKKIVKVVSNE